MKILSLIPLLLLLACGEQDQKDTNVQGQNQKLVRQYFDHFNQHNWQKMADMYIDKPSFKDPSLGTGIVEMSKEEIVAKYTELGNVFQDVHDQVLKMYPSGDQNVIVEFVSTGTAPDGETFELPICTIFTIEDGKITKDFSYFDNF